MNRTAIVYALVAAALFGVSTPITKALLGRVDPFVLAGLLYAGAGVGVLALRVLRNRLGDGSTVAEAPLARRDVPWLAGAIGLGGVAAPVLLMLGLTRTDAAATSLLLTMEGVATALMAWFMFHEPFDRRIALGMGCLVAGALVLSWGGEPSLAGVLGPLAIAGACLAWGLDNNLTRKVSLSDPLRIVELKGLVAGPVNIAVGLAAGGALPPTGTIALAAIVGFLGYGISLALFVVALRHLGTARTGAYFSTAPFLGAVASLALLGESLSLQLVAAGVLMAVGVWLHVTEHHAHEHEHEPLEHAHAHVHDAHHQHEHAAGDPRGEPHTHRHRHAGLRHSHAHAPDMHHQHRH